ncbi:MAG: amidohydrolase [Clostridia bacterium]|nr:amidohydrolase [Clostridia bacterium]
MQPAEIRDKVEGIKARVIEWRREIHRNPELGFEEEKTAALVAGVLEGLGLEVTRVAGTGVVGLLRGAKPGKTIALRADMDALPIEEESGVDFASGCPGVMHACGHDAHTAILLGTATVLTGLREQLSGQVKFIFQPSEERPPGGAEPMIAEGVMESPTVDTVVGLHVVPHLPAGFVGVKPGSVMAAADNFDLAILGKGGHGATPHLTVDPIVIAAEVVLALQAIPSRRVDPLEPIVITVGEIKGGQAPNIIPEKVYLRGTIRTLNQILRSKAPKLIEQTVKGITEAHGAAYELEYQPGYPVVINHEETVQLVREAASQVLGEDRVVVIPRPTMGGEDFAFFAQKAPGCFFFLGVARQGEVIYPWHHPKFNLDEEALPAGVAVFCQTVVDFLAG